MGVDTGRNQVSAREHYDAEKKDALNACIGLEGATAVQCATEAIEAAQEQSQSRQDLYAQQDMAQWAFWMLIATITTAFITAIGVLLVKQTLDATLEAVEDTGKATKAMVRQNEISEAQFLTTIKPDAEISISGPYDNDYWQLKNAHRDGKRAWQDAGEINLWACIVLANRGAKRFTITEYRVGFLVNKFFGLNDSRADMFTDPHEDFFAVRPNEEVNIGYHGITEKQGDEWHQIRPSIWGFVSPNNGVVEKHIYGSCPIVGVIRIIDTASHEWEIGFGFVADRVGHPPDGHPFPIPDTTWKRWGAGKYNYEDHCGLKESGKT